MTLPTALLATLTLACGTGGPPEGEVPVGIDGGTGTTTTDGGTTTGTGVDGIAGVRGQAVVELVGKKDWTYDGTEELYYESLDGASWCSVSSSVAPVDAGVPACGGCDWSFTLQTSDSSASGCDVDAADFNGATFSYGYVQGKGYGILAYYYAGYGWYGTYATASWDSGSGDFQYDWPQDYFTYYAP